MTALAGHVLIGQGHASLCDLFPVVLNLQATGNIHKATQSLRLQHAGKENASLGNRSTLQGEKRDKKKQKAKKGEPCGDLPPLLLLS
jgi:hypothetical protein